jgi:site-specific DNA-methyltransferase (adenine-specific)
MSHTQRTALSSVCNLKSLFVQVKSGQVKSEDISDFRGTLEREKAPMGVFITLEPGTKDMDKESLEAGKYLCPWNQEQYPRIQILTIEQLLADENRPNPHILRMPPSYAGETFNQAAKAMSNGRSQQLEVL